VQEAGCRWRRGAAENERTSKVLRLADALAFAGAKCRVQSADGGVFSGQGGSSQFSWVVEKSQEAGGIVRVVWISCLSRI
jgi:hypothetical protein